MMPHNHAHHRSSALAATEPDINLAHPAASSSFERWQITALISALFIVSLFSAFPAIDLFVSGLFFDPDEGFFLQGSFLVTSVNYALKRGLELFACCAFAMCLLGLMPRFRKQSRAWLFFVLSFTIGPGLIVNLFLKAEVGRARPREIEDFGGDRFFTPILQVADQCAQNCSFSSGEVAMTSTFVFASLAVIWSLLSARSRLAAALAGGAVIGISAGMRIGLGAHFLSDTLASTAISALVVLLTWRLTAMGSYPPRKRLQFA